MKYRIIHRKDYYFIESKSFLFKWKPALYVGKKTWTTDSLEEAIKQMQLLKDKYYDKKVVKID